MNTQYQIDFSAGVESSYVELPVPAAYLKWTRGNPQMTAMKTSDPGQYWGGFRAMVKNKEGDPHPSLPLPIYTRVSKDGRKEYEVYASPVINFLPLAHRTRFELREKFTDPNTGEERTAIKATSRSKAPGYAPRKEVFGLVFSEDLETYEPAVIMIDNWSAFINFQRAEAKFAKIKAAPGTALVRKYGTVGKTDKTTGKVIPNMETLGQAVSTPIEAIDVSDPQFVEVSDEIAKLYYESQEWSSCEKWNKEGTRGVEEDDLSAKGKFLRRAAELRYTPEDIEQELAAAGGDYRVALTNIDTGSPVESESENEFPF